MRAKHGIPLATRVERSRHRAVVAEDHPIFLVRVNQRALSIFKNVFLGDLDAFAKQQPLHAAGTRAQRRGSESGRALLWNKGFGVQAC